MLQIIVVEDDPAEAHLLSLAIREAGVPVRIVVLDDGVKALDYIVRNRRECDLVLLDLNLPRISGFEVLARVKKQEDLRAIPVVIFSGSTDPADVERCYRLGANSYICKPTHLEAIYTMAK